VDIDRAVVWHIIEFTEDLSVEHVLSVDLAH